ncbi:MAG: hypothetical protein HQM16_03340 [Deltaproteobacteria bacterium]|nr:hypothetical protein [Deltaproteobacteria bacterium]
MLYLLFKKLLANFGFQLAMELNLASFITRIEPGRSFCVLKRDSVDWYLPTDAAEQYLTAYSASPYFQNPQNKMEAGTAGYDLYRFMVPFDEYEQILHIMYFLQSGFIESFFIENKSFIYPEILIREHSVFAPAQEATQPDVEAFIAELDKYPNMAILHNYIGKLYIEKGEIGKASTYFVNATEKEPQYAEPYSNMGALVWNTESKKKGFNLFCEAFIRNPFDATLQDNFLKAGIELGEAQVMNDFIQRTQDFYPEYAGMLYVRALLLQKLGRIDECKEVIKEYLKKYPDDEAALKVIEEINAHPAEGEATAAKD